MVLLAAGILFLRSRSEGAPTAVRVDSAAGVAARVDRSPPQTPEAQASGAALAGAVSLAELAKEARARTSTSTTRPRPTTTTTRQTTTTSSPRATTVTTTRAQVEPAPPATAAKPVTTSPTLLEGIVPPPAALSSALTESDSGIASWFNAPDATCAHLTLPMGTAVKVTRIATGASTTCRVNDRGPTKETGRLIDLSLDTFEKLADRAVGLIDVTIEW